MIVVDANAMVAALLDSGGRGARARRAMTDDVTWLAPGHMPLEVLRTLRRQIVAGMLTDADAVLAVDALRRSEIAYVGTSDELIAAVWRLRHNVSAYDAAYLAVAVTYEAALVTADARLAKAAQQTVPGVDVIVL